MYLVIFVRAARTAAGVMLVLPEGLNISSNEGQAFSLPAQGDPRTPVVPVAQRIRFRTASQAKSSSRRVGRIPERRRPFWT